VFPPKAETRSPSPTCLVTRSPRETTRKSRPPALCSRENPSVPTVSPWSATSCLCESIDEGIDFSEVVYRGHPCLLAYPKSVALAVLLFSGGLTIASSTGRDLYWIIGLILALIVLLLVLLERSFQIYTVTGQRIELHTGILARSSKEVRIRDIRAININRSGLLGIFGVGRIEFSSAGSEEIEVAFDDVWGARRVKKIVRGLQDGT